MNLNDPQANGEATPATGRAVILTSYLTRLPGVKRLGLPGYSYDIVARLLVPLLQRWGEVVPVPLDPEHIEAAIGAARRRGLQPIQLSVLPFQDVYLTRSAPNVVFPFWEFPDVPAEAFDGNPQNNWVATANRCDLVLVCGPFTANALQRAGIRTPIHMVPVPAARAHFQLPPWSAETTTRIACSAYVFPNAAVPPEQRWDAPDTRESPENRAVRPSLTRTLLGRLRQTYRQMFKPLVPPIVHQRLRDRVRPVSLDPWQSYLRGSRREELELSGIVYTSIFSPQDGRKNRDDLLSGFLAALRDCSDATLVVKLAAADMLWIDTTLNYYRTAGLAHRCKVVFITDYLSDEQMLALARASTYYLTTTRAEGCCLPLLDFLAAGRPGVAPCHTAISDYFSPEMGFIMASAPERAIWPQDKRVRFKTMWNRLVWPSVVEQIRNSYQAVRNDRSVYAAMAAAARARVSQWAEPEAVWPRLRAALDSVDTRRSTTRAA
jgi:glycosyltransferase involved in cell wall biosynthesis